MLTDEGLGIYNMKQQLMNVQE